MIDTLLQLFVVFMLNMSFVMSTAPLTLPQAAAKPEHPEPTIIVSVKGDGAIFLDADRVALADLPNRVRARLRNIRSPDVVLRAEGSLKYEQVVKVLLAIRGGGAEHVELAYEQM